jgi:hypothetical protein
MSAETETAFMEALATLLANYSDSGADDNDLDDVADTLYSHFTDFGRWDWCEIVDETRRVWNLMFDQTVEPDSPMDAVWAAAAAQASRGTLTAVAAALGVEPFALERALSPWLDHQDSHPPPITAERLLGLCEEAVIARRKRLVARNAKGNCHG